MAVPVNSTRPDYDSSVRQWQLIRSVVNSDVKKYIRQIDVSDPRRCIQYRNDAQFTNFTARTKSGLLGAIFRKEAVITLPDSIQYLNNDATGYKMSLGKLCQEVTGEVLMMGRYGLLVDYPASDENLTAADIEKMNLNAKIYRYKSENIINWQTKIENGSPIVSLIVLKECFSTLDTDGFTWIQKTQYRVLRMENGIYNHYEYDGDSLEVISHYVPRDASGNPWEFIPFVFVGSEDNDSEIDAAPLFDLAMLNLGHLKNSADFEESVHIVGQPTLIIATDMSQEDFKASNPNGVIIGARSGHNLGIGGKAEFLQANPNQLADAAMKRKEEQAIMMGARLIVPAADRETAEAARMRHSGETSILSTIGHNVEDALITCCEYIARFMSPTKISDTAISIKLNNIYFDAAINPQLIMAQIQMLNNQVLAVKDVRDNLRTYGLIEEFRTDEQIDKEAKKNPAPEVTSLSLKSTGAPI